MNEPSKEKLDEFVGQAIGFVEQSGQFVKEQAPLYVQEYLHYYFWVHLVWGLATLGLALLCARMAAVAWGKTKKEAASESFMADAVGPGLLTAVLALSAFGLFCWSFESLIDAWAAWAAPRVVVVDHLRSLL